MGASIRIFELMDRIPEVQNGTMISNSFIGGRNIFCNYYCFVTEIKFKNVKFSYPSRPNEVVLQVICCNSLVGLIVIEH